MQLSIIASTKLNYSENNYPDITQTTLWMDFETEISLELAKNQSIYVVYDTYKANSLRLSLCKISDLPVADFDLLNRHYRIFPITDSVPDTWEEILALESHQSLARAYKFDVVSYDKHGARQIEISI